MTRQPRPAITYTSAVSARRPIEHLQCDDGDVGGYVLLPGDPTRVPVIAAHLNDAREVAWSREFRTITGTLDGVPVSVTSTGIGGPSAAIAVEELAQLGAHTVLRVGTCGAMQPYVRVGDLVVVAAAVRDEGTSRQYAPLAYPAVSDPQLTQALADAAADQGFTHHTGVVHTTDTYYGQHEPERMPIAAELTSGLTVWQRLGVLCSEMEAAPVLVVAGAVLGLRAGAVLAVAGNRLAGEHLADPTILMRRDDAVTGAVTVAVDAIRRLIAADATPQT